MTSSRIVSTLFILQFVDFFVFTTLIFFKGRMFKAQTARLLAGMEEDPTIYARDLHAVQRLSKGASELTSNVVEKLMCNIFATLHRTSRHAKRKTVKLEDFQLYLDCLEA